MRKSLVQLSLLLVLAGIFLCEQVKADFIRTSSSVYQSSLLRTKVVVSQELPGIFILDGPPAEVQQFDLEKAMDGEGVSHVLVRFNPDLNRYTSIVLGEREYPINGNLNLILGKTRVAVDNTNPYLSIVAEPEKLKESTAEVLGFLGLVAVISRNGEQAVALLEANQLSEYRRVISPYEVLGGVLFIKGKEVTTPSIGVNLEFRNACLNKDALIIDKEALTNVLSISDEKQRKTEFAKLVEAAKSKSAWRGLIRLRVSVDNVISLDTTNSTIKLVKQEVENSSAGRVLCSIDEIRL